MRLSRFQENGYYRLYENKILEEVILPAKLQVIGDGGVFYSCTNLKTVNIPETVTKIGTYAFTSCTNLNNITWGQNIETIGDYAFAVCKGVTSITIPSSVTSIGKNAFYNCSSLAEVKFEMTTAPTFGRYCFYKTSGSVTTFYFKNSTVSDALTSSHYSSTYGTKSEDYSW